MKTPRLSSFRKSGFMLTELLAGAAAAAIVLSGLMTGVVALQRSFAASEQLAAAQMDLLRVSDYMSRDVRNATSITANSSPTVLLTVTMGDYYDRKGTPADRSDDVANSPSLGRYGAVYGTSAVTVRYIRSGSKVSREVTHNDSGKSATTTTLIAESVDAIAVSVSPARVVTVTSSANMSYRTARTGVDATRRTFVIAANPRNPL